MSKPVNNENFSLEQITDKIKQHLRGDVENALRVGELLLEAEQKFPAGMTFEKYCANNFQHHAQSTLYLYKRMAKNLKGCLPNRPSVADEILKMGVHEADDYLSEILKGATKGASNAAKKATRTSATPKVMTPPKEPSELPKLLTNVLTDENDSLYHAGKVVKEIIYSQRDEKLKKRTLNMYIKYLKDAVSLEAVPDVKREISQPSHMNGAHSTPSVSTSAATT